MKTRKIALLCIALSLVMMFIGAQRGEVETVLKKAVVLCLECIGIG